MTGLHIFTLPSPLVPRIPDATAYAAGILSRGRPILEATIDLMGRIYRLRLRPPLHDHRHPAGRGHGAAQRGLSGLRPRRHRRSARTRTRRPLCQRLSGNPTAAGAGQAPRRRRLPRLVLGAGPGLGWVDFDPTNDQIPGEQHITTAVGRDFQDVTPMRGIFYGGGTHELRVAVDVCSPCGPGLPLTGTGCAAGASGAC
jgi:hypothetical protein